jgi:uncharacterized protein YkwD
METLMRKSIWTGITVIVISLMATAGLAAAAPDRNSRGTIRGGVYEDVAGDGRCVAGERPVAGIDVSFVTAGPAIILHTGSDGTFGLVAAGQGAWQVTARPNASEWVVTSANPRIVQVNAFVGLVQTDVNFCVKRTGPGSATSGLAGLTTYAAVLAELTAKGVVEPPVVSEALLTAPVGPAPTALSPEVTVKSVEEDAPPAAAWLTYLNLFRDMGGLSPLAESETLNYGSQLHSRYMVVNDRPVAHSENVNNPLYDPAGQQAAKNGNIFATSQIEANHVWATNFWISAPFHLVPIIDPQLGSVGFGRYNQEVGTFHMAAVVDVRTELGNGDTQAQYPLFFPGNGAETWVVRHSLYEWPDPVSSCPGYSRPTGAPIVLQLGDGSLTPRVTNHSLRLGDQFLESCLFHENSYANPNAFAQRTGRIILDERDAIVILPRRPLAIDQTYDVQIDANGQSYSWSFSTRRNAP